MPAVVAPHGPSGPTPLVLLHAFPLDSRMWADVVPRLPQIPVLTLDLPGFGAAAGHRWAAEPSMEAMATEVTGALQRTGVQRAVVAGLSMGGYVAMAMAEHHRELLAGIGLLDTKAGADDDQARQVRLTMAEQVMGEQGTAVLDPMVQRLLGATSLAHRPEVVDRVRSWLSHAPVAGVAAAQRAMAQRPDRLAVLAELAVPALVLRGAQDALAGAAEHEQMAQALGTEVLTIDDSGHLPAIEDPEPVARALADLYRRAVG